MTEGDAPFDGVFDDSYRKAHQDFVSNHNGTSAVEILGLSLFPPIGVLINSLSLLVLHSVGPTGVGYRADSDQGGVAFEFSVIALPSLLSLTCCSEVWPFVLAAFSGILAVFLVVVRRLLLLSGSSRPGPVFGQIPAPTCSRSSYVTNYRAGMLFVTALCILAVDFPSFPRRFAKAETFGFGLMDIGVGSFVFSTGLLSIEARRGTGWISGNRVLYVRKLFRDVLPMILLGVARLVSLKIVGYHEHVSEYGVHWNFFFTLGVVKMACGALFIIGFPADLSWFAGLAVIASHEMWLGISTGKWVLDADLVDRDTMDLVSANREGIVSSVGFAAIYLAGVSCGLPILKAKTHLKEYASELKTLGIWSVLMWLSLLYSKEALLMAPSRRFANWSYFNWMVAYNMTLLTVYLACDIFMNYAVFHIRRKANQMKGKKSKVVDCNPSNIQFSIPLVNRSISRHSLVYFLLANLLTGIINMSFKTVYISGCPAILIIGLYLITLHLFVVVLYKKRSTNF